MYTDSQKKFLLKIARDAIKKYLDKESKLEINKNEVDADLREERGVFVTLTKDGNLRGCIGHIEPIQELYLDVIDNAVNAAFHDPRFPHLRKEEFDSIKIEISILSETEDLEYEDAEDLIGKLKPEIDGVILGSGFNQATFLPQVWEELKEPETFLSHLSMKAGLPSDAWKNQHLKVQTYQVEKFEE